MASGIEKYKSDLEKLIQTSEVMKNDLLDQINNSRSKKGSPEPGQLFMGVYQEWYSQARTVVGQLLPERLDEFTLLYSDSKRKAVNGTTYTIQDWLLGTRAATDRYTGERVYNDGSIVFMKFQLQMGILRSARARFESSLFDIKQIAQADLFDSELNAARELLANGFLRPAGAMAGVVLERHLLHTCGTHRVSITKKTPTIADINDALKTGGVLDVPGWRFVQRLGDIRNLCVHQRQREPKSEEVLELIEGVEKITKTTL